MINILLFYTYWDLHTRKTRVKFVRNLHPTNQKRVRLWNTSFVQSETRTIVLHRVSQWRATSTRFLWKQNGGRNAKICTPWRNNRWLHRWERKQKHESKNRDVSLVKPFLQRKVELINGEEIPPAQLSEFLSEFVFNVRSKDGNDYEATSRPRKSRVWSSSSDEDKGNYLIQTRL